MDPNKFDIEALRLNSDEDLSSDLAEDSSDLPVRKPKRQEFFRVHSDENMRFATKLLHFDADKKWYLIAKNLWVELCDELTSVSLLTCINDDSARFFWPLKQSMHGMSNGWNDSSLHAAKKAVSMWIRLVPDMPNQKYRVQSAHQNLPEPEWESCTLNELVEKAFKDAYIDSLDHPVIKKLRGMP